MSVGAVHGPWGPWHHCGQSGPCPQAQHCAPCSPASPSQRVIYTVLECQRLFDSSDMTITEWVQIAQTIEVRRERRWMPLPGSGWAESAPGFAQGKAVSTSSLELCSVASHVSSPPPSPVAQWGPGLSCALCDQQGVLCFRRCRLAQPLEGEQQYGAGPLGSHTWATCWAKSTPTASPRW